MLKMPSDMQNQHQILYIVLLFHSFMGATACGKKSDSHSLNYQSHD